MKKPVRKTEDQILAIIEKRKNIQIRDQRKLKGGDLVSVTKQFADFAKKFGVKVTDVRVYTPTCGGSYVTAKRVETDKEKAARVRKEINEKYRRDLSNWKYQEIQRQRLEATTRNTCSCNCRYCKPRCEYS